jgi:putative transposase
MALDQSALLEALKAAEVDDRIRQAAETIYQALIEAELTAVVGAQPASAHRDSHQAAEREPGPDDQHDGRGPGAEDPAAAGRVVFPSLLERRRRMDQSLFAVIMEAYLNGTNPQGR